MAYLLHLHLRLLRYESDNVHDALQWVISLIKIK